MIWTSDWTEASEDFRARAGRVGTLERHSLGGTGPDGTPLTLDVARIGPPEARSCVLVSAGLHGVEGIAGSAILRAWLAGGVPRDRRIVLLHVLNPFGFAWGRRADQNNVDLNRSFLLDGDSYRGAAPGWDRIGPRLSPPRPAPLWGPLLPTLLLLAAREGYGGLAAAVAGGQHSHPRAIFYGGDGPSPLQHLLARELPRWTAGALEVLHIDIHTGLGRSGALQLLLPRVEGSDEARDLQRHFGPDAIPARSEPRHFRTRGALGPWCEALLPGIRYTLCAAEFGTRSPVAVLKALCHENRAHFWSRRDSLAAVRARARLRRAFAPSSGAWRDKVLARGTRLIDQAVAPPSDPVEARP
jgi:hypothetical protein